RGVLKTGTRNAYSERSRTNPGRRQDRRRSGNFWIRKGNPPELVSDPEVVLAYVKTALPRSACGGSSSVAGVRDTVCPHLFRFCMQLSASIQSAVTQTSSKINADRPEGRAPDYQGPLTSRRSAHA